VWDESYSEDDRKLIVRCREGDQLAFEELVRKYQQTIFNLACHYVGYRDEVEDIAQKIFLKVYFSLPKFDIRRPFFPWLYRIAINQCYDELRRVRREKAHTFSELSLEETGSLEKLISASGTSAAVDENRQELHTLLHRVLEQLPDQQRLVIVLRDLEAVSYEKMAEILKCTEQAARLKVFRARSRLRTMLEKALRRRGRPGPR
jgi:RNA polymerase sigma-70 factor (ECF subfamily)